MQGCIDAVVPEVTPGERSIRSNGGGGGCRGRRFHRLALPASPGESVSGVRELPRLSLYMRSAAHPSFHGHG